MYFKLKGERIQCAFMSATVSGSKDRTLHAGILYGAGNKDWKSNTWFIVHEIELGSINPPSCLSFIHVNPVPTQYPSVSTSQNRTQSSTYPINSPHYTTISQIDRHARQPKIPPLNPDPASPTPLHPAPTTCSTLTGSQSETHLRNLHLIAKTWIPRHRSVCLAQWNGNFIIAR